MDGDYKTKGEIMKKVIVIFIFITVILTCHNFILHIMMAKLLNRNYMNGLNRFFINGPIYGITF